MLPLMLTVRDVAASLEPWLGSACVNEAAQMDKGIHGHVGESVNLSIVGMMRLACLNPGQELMRDNDKTKEDG